MSLEAQVRHLASRLNRSITVEGAWIVQKCPVCDIELKLLADNTPLPRRYRELFSFYDAHRCHAVPDEIAYQRAERTFVRVSEAALALARYEEDPVLVQRAELESDRLAKFVEWFEHGTRGKVGGKVGG